MKTTKLVVALVLASCLIQSSRLNAQPNDRSQQPNNRSQQPNNPTQIRTEKVGRFVPPPLPDRGVPRGRRKGAASRTALRSCPLRVFNLTALVPEIEKNKPWGLTFAEHPTFWVFIPALPGEVRSAEFVLQDEEDRDVYRTQLVLLATSGIMRIDLPDLPQYSLEIDKSYRWTFRIFCDPQQQSYYVSVDGIIKRVAKNDNNVSSVWYDILTDLANRRLAAPEDIQLRDDWAQLMRQIDLEELDQTGLLPCCGQAQSQLPTRI